MYSKNFLRKLWWDGKTGHGTYLIFFLTFSNFILITYNFLLEGSEIFTEFISDLWLFGIIFVILYFPISILIGRWHTQTQISVDNTIKILEDPMKAKMIRTLLDVQTGRATKGEIEEFRKEMLEVEKGDIKEF